ncbi:enoyl-CoA hydratase/isomerase family protein [Bordetella pertussis]|uniref:enoyl-CoA hydratase/isomerase family protein n=1 Tax=Bordetella pertussis TaxID=520 RepID=UPI00031C6C04|nr:enoyl-CoA hydratase/isomerase family protein [Bordetella pertussis]AUR73833.1 enoyl-CoA hydratase/isomerase family protein [Bordetella pertussis]KCV20595.1 enoyl-CoA hydratase/isomerase family protein [Bordetella pertussis B200]QKC07053.1 enoyl-CoA hydratase/isomerase family protein [Bordetella pertussis]WLE81447.1 enoyl-CoA hydratase/isomerase family protein [Bordetella pertussis]
MIMSVLEISRVGACAVLTLNRPAARNALDMDLRNALAKALPEIRDDATVRAVVLTGAGGHFCAGGDIRAIAAGQGNADVFEGRNRILSMQRWFDGLVDLEKPVIAAVDGVAFGADLSLALAADFVLASPRATFCAVFARLGYVPDLGGMYLLPRAVGLARAKALAFSARVVGAPEALEMGIAHQLVDDRPVLDAALELAGRFEQAPAGALGIVKSVMNHAFESDRRTVYMQEALAQALCRESAFHQEAARRFLDKQAPLYQWPQEQQ